MIFKTLPKLTTLLVLSCITYNSIAADVADRTINSTKLLNNFSSLNDTEQGRKILDQNLEVSLQVNNKSSAEQRQQAIYDNTLLAMFGSMSNGLLLADALGENMSKVYFENNSINKNMTFKTFSPNFESLFMQVNAMIQIDSGFAKNYLANGTSDGKTAYSNPLLSNKYNIYDAAYNPLDEHKNTVGNSRPVQVVAGKDKDADGYIDSFTGTDFFGDHTDTAKDILPTVASNAAFPSGHSAFGFATSFLFAQLVPEKFQDFALRGSEYGNSRVTLGVHYALDVIGARIMTTYTLAQILNNNPDYVNQDISMLGNTMQTSGDFKALMYDARKDLRIMLETGCNASISDCIAKDTQLSKEQLAKNREEYRTRLTYGLKALGDTTLAPVVPEGAEVLIETRFPYLTAEQRRDVIATTEIESGHALDDGSGWARINLFDAAGGYGSINDTVSITMNADDGGFSAYDVWNNDIAGSGDFIKNGTGTLELSGDNTFNGTTTVKDGKLVVSGSLEHSTITVEENGSIAGDGKVGNLTLNDHATYSIDIDPNSSNIGLHSTDAISLNDNTLKVSVSNLNNIDDILGNTYQILSADNGITGQFANIENQYQFIDSKLSQSTNDISLSLNRNAKKFADIADTQNQSSVANSIENLNSTNPLYSTIIGSSAAQSSQLKKLYTELSGQIYADAFSSLLNESRYSRDILNKRLEVNRSNRLDSDIKGNPLGLWGSFIAEKAKTSNDNDIHGFDSKTYGFMIGLDKAIGENENSTIGVAAGISRSSLDKLYDTSADADIDSYHLGIYGDHKIQNWTLKGGGIYSWHKVDAKRTVLSNGLSDKYDAQTRQLFAELSYATSFNKISVEPYLNLAYVNVKADSINENGPTALKLTADKQDKNLFLSTLGARINAQWKTESNNTIYFRNELGWQHQFNSKDRDYELTLNQSSAPFSVQSVAASRDGAVLKTSLAIKTANDLEFSLGYNGLLSSNYKNHGLNANLNWNF